jgi:hypothetical protein
MSVTLSMQNTTTVVESNLFPSSSLKFNHKINYVLIFQIPASIPPYLCTYTYITGIGSIYLTWLRSQRSAIKRRQRVGSTSV